MVRTGAAAGARGAVIGKRGEKGRVVAGFSQQVLAAMRPGDQVRVRAVGQGWRPAGVSGRCHVLSLTRELLSALPVSCPATRA